MGTLTDITAKANNVTKRPASRTHPSQALKTMTPDESLAKSKSPHFMTPTLSSVKQSVPASTNAHDRTSTPSSLTSSKVKVRGGWMASAAKRVGLRHNGDGTPRSRKESLPNNTKTPSALTFPDKLAPLTCVQLPDSPIVPTTENLVSTLSEKPLPSPPFAQVLTSSPAKEARTLLDASVKPLRRSPPGMPHRQEDWPVLFPEKPTTPDTLQALVHQGGLSASPSMASHQIERYPLLPSVNHHSMHKEDGGLGSKTSSNHTIPRKQLPSGIAKSSSGITLLPSDTDNAAVHSIGHKEGDGAMVNAAVLNAAPLAQLLDLSAGAAAIEKSAEPSKAFNQPRQTRTSSLRARISAGQLIKDGPAAKNKVVGFTDFTTVKDPLARASDGDLRARGQSRSLPWGPSHDIVPGVKPFRASMPRNRAPAQFVGGSRRPVTHHRPSSHSSLRNESRATSPSLTLEPPSRPAPTVPTFELEMYGASTSAQHEKGKVIGQQRSSSIPAFRQLVSNMVNEGEHGRAPPPKQDERTQVKVVPRNEFSIYEDKDARYPNALEAIKESPRQAYELKRLSMTSPEYGPTLSISPSAERFIMGVNSKGVNAPKLNTIKSKELRLGAATTELQEVRDRESSSVHNKRLERPLSSQGFPQSTYRRSLVDVESREKKVKSADISYSLPTNPFRRSLLSRLETRPQTSDSSTDDPFYDAVDVLDGGKTEHPDTGMVDGQGQQRNDAADEKSWTTPMPQRQSLISLTDSMTVISDYLPVSMQEHVSKGHDFGCQQPDEVLIAPGNNVMANGDFKHVGKGEVISDLPSTPEQMHTAGSSNSGSFPPRSSSHTNHPDYTLNGSAKPSPDSLLDRISKIPRTDSVGKPYPPEEFVARQNNLGSRRGNASSEFDAAILSTKRDSSARESNKSQNSVSKGMLSNFRGLFHKRFSDASEPHSSVRSGRKGKQPVPDTTHNGSPFPPITEVHPIHRPTLASRNRSNAKATPGDTYITIGSNTPSFNSPLPTEVSTTTTLAMQLLESARHEPSSPKKERMLQLGKIVVDAVTQARDAEKAMEEAKLAARKAEVAHALCQRSVGDVAKLVREWNTTIGKESTRG